MVIATIFPIGEERMRPIFECARLRFRVAAVEASDLCETVVSLLFRFGERFKPAHDRVLAHHLTPAFLSPATNSSNSLTRPDSMIQTPIAAGVAP